MWSLVSAQRLDCFCSNLRLGEYSKIRLEDALRSSEHQGVPNAFRTAVCFELLGAWFDLNFTFGLM